MRTKLKYGVMYKERYNESGKLVKYIPEIVEMYCNKKEKGKNNGRI